MSSAFYTFHCHPHTSQDTTQFYAAHHGDPASVVKAMNTALQTFTSDPGLAGKSLDVLFAHAVPDAIPVTGYHHEDALYHYVYTAPVEGELQEGYLDAYVVLNNGEADARECIFSGTLSEFCQRCQDMQLIAATA